MSFVLWYSIVAFQCLKVWKWICISLGFCSLRARLARCFWNRRLWVLRCFENRRFRLLLFCMARSMLSSLFESLKMRGLLPFSGVIRTVPVSKSMSVHFRLWASPDLAPVSFKSCRNVEVLGPQPEIKASNSASVGMKGSFSATLYRGGSHFPPFIRRKAV